MSNLKLFAGNTGEWLDFLNKSKNKLGLTDPSPIFRWWKKGGSVLCEYGVIVEIIETANGVLVGIQSFDEVDEVLNDFIQYEWLHEIILTRWLHETL